MSNASICQEQVQKAKMLYGDNRGNQKHTCTELSLLGRSFEFEINTTKKSYYLAHNWAFVGNWHGMYKCDKYSHSHSRISCVTNASRQSQMLA